MDRKGENSFARKLLNTKLQSDGQTSPPLLQFVLDPDFLQFLSHISLTQRWSKINIPYVNEGKNTESMLLGYIMVTWVPQVFLQVAVVEKREMGFNKNQNFAFSWPTTTCQKGNRRTQSTHSVSWSLCWIICFLLLNASSILCLLDLTHRLVRNLKPNKKCQ